MVEKRGQDYIPPHEKTEHGIRMKWPDGTPFIMIEHETITTPRGKFIVKGGELTRFY